MKSLRILILNSLLFNSLAYGQVVKSSSGSQSGDDKTTKLNFTEVTEKIVKKANDRVKECSHNKLKDFQNFAELSLKLVELDTMDAVAKTMIDPTCQTNENLAFKMLICLLPKRHLNQLREMTEARVPFLNFIESKYTNLKKEEPIVIVTFYQKAFNMLDQRDAVNRTDYVPPGK